MVIKVTSHLTTAASMLTTMATAEDLLTGACKVPHYLQVSTLQHCSTAGYLVSPEGLHAGA